MNFIKYLWRAESRLQVIIAFFFLIILCVGIFNSKYVFCDRWSQFIDPIITIFTLFIGMFIWINEKHQDYLQSLPKKLNIAIKDKDDKILMEVLLAPLTGSDDIRMWGQQLGRQMNQNKDLPISGFEVGNPVIDENSGIKFRSYSLTIYLSQTKVEIDSSISSSHETKRVYNMNGKLIVS